MSPWAAIATKESKYCFSVTRCGYKRLEKKKTGNKGRQIGSSGYLFKYRAHSIFAKGITKIVFQERTKPTEQ